MESSAAFEARASAMGLTQDELDKMKAAGVATYALLAFSCNYTPGGADEKPLLDLAKIVLGDPVPAARLPILRRLFFESYTLAAADLRRRVERTDDAAPLKLPAAERAARRKEQADRLTGLDLAGELEPSHALVDLFVQQAEDNILRYVGWDQCTKRDQEIAGAKKDKVWKADANGVIKEVRQDSAAVAQLGTDLRLKYALQRRGLAMDQARITTFGVHEKWVNRLIQEFLREPPEGYGKVSVQQLARADRELFKVMAEEARAGIQQKVDGARPLDLALMAAMAHTTVNMMLVPLPSLGSNHDVDSDNPTPKQRPRVDHARRRQPAKLVPRQRDSAGPRMPRDLMGVDGKTTDGQPICYGFNLPSGCSHAAPGGKCGKGLHVCCRPGCQEPHSMQQCSK